MSHVTQNDTLFQPIPTNYPIISLTSDPNLTKKARKAQKAIYNKTLYDYSQQFTPFHTCDVGDILQGFCLWHLENILKQQCLDKIRKIHWSDKLKFLVSFQRWKEGHWPKKNN